jgi:hypothetical protein
MYGQKHDLKDQSSEILISFYIYILIALGMNMNYFLFYNISETLTI